MTLFGTVPVKDGVGVSFETWVSESEECVDLVVAVDNGGHVSDEEDPGDDGDTRNRDGTKSAVGVNGKWLCR
jgi:hypothetical protein